MVIYDVVVLYYAKVSEILMLYFISNTSKYGDDVHHVLDVHERVMLSLIHI